MPNDRGTVRQAVREFRQEERQEFRYLLSVTLAIGFSWVFWLIPGPIRGWIADHSGDLFYRISNTYPDNVRDNVQTVLDYIGDARMDPEPLVPSIFRTSARNFMDLIITPRQPARSFLTSVRLVSGSWQTLDRVLEAGKGGILVSGHVGSIDYIGQVLTVRGYKLTVVTGRTTSRFIFDGVSWLRASRGATLVEPTPSGIRKVMKAVRRNEFAVFVTDRDFFQNGQDVVFMGRQTTLPPGPVRIARETGAPLIPVFTRRVARGHELTISEPFHIERTSDVRADMAVGMERLVEVLEAGIISSLDQWVMFQRVWLEPQRVPVRVFPVGSPLESELLER
ncbi:MAG TPA: lysophospholipid acyltransferase family protein, partial [Thermomicrobiales bacterium]|nr:lysophospholipid acyltransferase family protein [Thermomicrobiales bacterium]